MAKLRVGVVFGGRSGEHEVSLMSARSIITALDPQKYTAIPVGITHAGQWVVGQEAVAMLDIEDLPQLESSGIGEVFPLTPVPDSAEHFDVIFPVLHGPHGEDGTIQGLLELANLAYVGAGVLASSVAMDKGMMRNVLVQAGLPLVKWATIARKNWENDSESVIELIETEIDYPCFVKPANLGSSVGITKATDRQGLVRAMQIASEFDRRIVVEEAVLNVREIECSVLGNDDPRPSIPGEIIPGNDFYDYEDKYINQKSQLVIPANLSSHQIKLVQEYAIQTFKAVDCAGMARVDFFLTPAGEIFVNEINTIPGFTPISMYPKLWEASGLDYSCLLDRLIELALERHGDRMRRRISYKV